MKSESNEERKQKKDSQMDGQGDPNAAGLEVHVKSRWVT